MILMPLDSHGRRLDDHGFLDIISTVASLDNLRWRKAVYVAGCRQRLLRVLQLLDIIIFNNR